MLASATAMILLVVGALALFANGADTDAPAADTTHPETTQRSTIEREQDAIDIATTFFAAFGRGDVDAVVGLSDSILPNAAAESELVRWWSTSAWPTQTATGWPDGACRSRAANDTGPVLVDCPLTVADPVAVALGADELLWSAEVSDDGSVRRRAEPLTAANGTYAPVWQAYAQHLSMYQPTQYAAVCDPAASPASEAFSSSGLALTGACAAVTSAASGEVAAWITDGRPEPAADPTTTTTQPAELPMTPDSLAGYWTNVGGPTSGFTALLVDFRRDGTFTIGNSGALGDGSFAGGTFAVEGDTIVFTGHGGGCDGETLVWTATRFAGGRLDVDVTPNGGCAPDASWNWVRVSPASAAGLELREGTSGAPPSAPEAARDLVGIWLRLGTGEVLAIDARGSYLVTTAGDTLSPDDSGRIQIEAPGVVVFTSDGSGVCQADETWTWTDVATAPDLLRDGNPRGTTMRTATSELCGSSESPSVWRLLSPDLAGG